MRTTSLLVVAALAGCGMRTSDIVAESVFSALTFIDWGQTNGITQGCREGNWVIGDCGQNIAPGLYFPTVIALHILGAWLLPEDWRGIFSGISIGFEIKSTLHNYELHDPVTF